jgi:hypothetical protein
LLIDWKRRSIAPFIEYSFLKIAPNPFYMVPVSSFEFYVYTCPSLNCRSTSDRAIVAILACPN